LPLSLKIALGAVHIEILCAHVTQQTGSNDQERQ
jgi:hypothetical protein